MVCRAAVEFGWGEFGGQLASSRLRVSGWLLLLLKSEKYHEQEEEEVVF